MSKAISVNDIVVKDTDEGQVLYIPIAINKEFRTNLENTVVDAIKEGINAYLAKFIYGNTKGLEVKVAEVVAEVVAKESRRDIVEAVASQLRIDDSQFIMALCKELSSASRENKTLKKAMKELVKNEVREAISEVREAISEAEGK